MARESTSVREARKNRKNGLWIAVIGGVATIVAAALGLMTLFSPKDVPPAAEVWLTGRVANALTDEPIRKALVQLETGGVPEKTESDSSGIFSAKLPADFANVRVRVTARGFIPYDQLLPRDRSRQIIPINLEPQPRAAVRPIEIEPRQPSSPRPRPVPTAQATILNTSLPTISGENGPWAVVVFGQSERRDELSSALRAALASSGRDTVSLFRKVADEQRLASDLFRGSSDVFDELQISRYCSRLLIANVAAVRLGTTEGITFARATLNVHVVSPAGEMLKTFELSEKGGGEDDSSARRHAFDQLIESVSRELPSKID